jgi:hypothetical protein
MVDLGAGSYLAGTYDSGSAPVALSIYKSSDYGDSWDLKTTVSVPTTLGYFRTMIKVSEDLVIAYASCSENSWADRCAEAYASTDAGETWTDLGRRSSAYGNMNAIYFIAPKRGRSSRPRSPDNSILQRRSATGCALPRCRRRRFRTCSALTAWIGDGSTSLAATRLC